LWHGRRQKEESAGVDASKKKTKAGVFAAGQGASVISEADGLDAINYRPRHRESKRAYEEILTIIQQNLGDQPADVLRGAADEVLAILKNDRLTDPQRLKEIQELIRRVTPERFNKLVTLGKQINDFRVGGSEESADVDEDQPLDEQMGVAVVFDEDDEEEEEEDIDEVLEEDEVSLSSAYRLWKEETHYLSFSWP